MALKDLNPVLIRSKSLILQDRIGEGGFGYVYRGICEGIRDPVAFKEIGMHSFNKDKMDRLMKEVYIHFSLNHPNIVKFYGLVFETGNQGKCGFVLEFMTNGDLLEYFINKRPNLSFKLRLLHDVASGMEYLHTRIPPIIHGDLKMNNILISDDLHAKITDFGFSQMKEVSQPNSKSKCRSGTVSHLPPEVWVDPDHSRWEEFDVYGFGILIWEIVMERHPYRGEKTPMISTWVQNGQRPDMSDFPDEASITLKPLMEWCWKQEAENRPTFPAANKCKVRLRSYSYENKISQAYGYIEVNGEKFLQGDITNNGLTGTSYRGVNMMEFDISTRRAFDWRWFDTCEWQPSFYGNNPKCHGNTSEFIEYFTNQVSVGTVLLGITMDDPMDKLLPAFAMLKEAGINVSDLKHRATFAFVVQKEFPEKTILLKSDPQPEAITLSVTITENVNDSGSRTILFELD